MALSPELLARLTQEPPEDAWRSIIETALNRTSQPLPAGNPSGEIIKRDREIGELDHFLSAGGWELWQSFGLAVERTAERLGRWWSEPYAAKAVC